MKTQNLIAGLLSLSASTPALAAPGELPVCIEDVTGAAARVANAYFEGSKITEQNIEVKHAKIIREKPSHHDHDVLETTFRAQFYGKSEHGSPFEGKVIVTSTRGGCIVEGFQFTAK